MFENVADPAISDVDGTRRASARVELAYLPPSGGRPVRGDPFPLRAPLGPIENEEIDWYLERYWRWPTSVFRERARRVEEQLAVWGRRIHDILSAQDAFEAWHRADGCLPRRFTLRDTSEAATRLLAFPWELAHNGRAATCSTTGPGTFSSGAPCATRCTAPGRRDAPITSSTSTVMR